MERNKFVCGFLFDTAHQRVALVQKARPEWQAGRWNGIGGKIELPETSLEAMHREFSEETGIPAGAIAWRRFVHLELENGGFVDFYSAASEAINDVCTAQDETVSVFPHWRLPNVLYNLKWLIPMARDFSIDLATITQKPSVK